MGIFGDVWGCLGGVVVCKGGWGGVSGRRFPSISFNFRKTQMRSLTFSRRPGGPRGLIYQNVPKIRSFWPIGKLRERFQSWVIRVYFIAVLLDHTVASQRLTYLSASGSRSPCQIYLRGSIKGCSGARGCPCGCPPSRAKLLPLAPLVSTPLYGCYNYLARVIIPS